MIFIIMMVSKSS